MKKIDLGQAITVLANLGVIAGIYFLVVEIRNNTTTARVSATLEASVQLASLNLSIAGDTSITEVYLKGAEEFQSLSPAERERLDRTMRAYLAILSGITNAGNFGLVGGAANRTQSAASGEIDRLIETSGFGQWWTQVDRRGLPGLIVNRVDERMNAWEENNERI